MASLWWELWQDDSDTSGQKHIAGPAQVRVRVNDMRGARVKVQFSISGEYS